MAQGPPCGNGASPAPFCALPREPLGSLADGSEGNLRPVLTKILQYYVCAHFLFNKFESTQGGRGAGSPSPA